MADMKTTRAPYNFVPMTERIIWRYEDASQLPRHDVLDPELLTGQIRVTITAETPIFISGREKGSFATDARGRYIIPGSSLRGLLRQNMQILGLGLIRPGEDFNDLRLLYRDMTSGRNTVSHPRRERYVGVLGIKTIGPRCTVATSVQGGYLHNVDGKYHIAPTASPVLRISRKDAVVSRWADRYAFEKEVWYLRSGDRVTDIKTSPTEGYAQGVLLSPGLMRKQDRLYLFPQEDGSVEVRVTLTDEEVLSYQEDVKMKQTGLKGTDKSRPMDPDFWNMPDPGKAKAVFYVKDSEGFTSFGISQFLRIGYAHSLGHGIPNKHREGQTSEALDLPSSLFGFTSDHVSYRTRISVGDLVADGTPRPLPQFSIVLGSPKPSFAAGYSQNGKDYDQDFRLNGLKQYWMKEAPIPKSNEDRQGNNEEKKSATKMAPLPSGTKFTGTIRYRNLHKDELGLLLWCLRLDPGHFQTIGMGKPYGFGRIAVQIDALEEFDIPGLYQDLTAGPVAHGTTDDRVEELIRAYDSFACDKAKWTPKKGERTLRSMSHIQDFLYMKKTIRTDVDAVSYLSLSEHRNIIVPLPTVASIRKEAALAAPSAAPKAALTAADLKAMFDRNNAANSASKPKRK